MSEATDIVSVFVTAPDKEMAIRLARRVVEERIAACGNVIPHVTSVYEWNEEIREDEEVLLILKTSGSCVASLITRLAELHSYETPEILVLPVEGGSEAYLTWVSDCTSVEAADNRTEC